MDLEEIKTKIKTSAILSDSEKSEWLFLLPKMTDAQKQELLRILEVRMPVQTEKPSTSPGLQPPSPGLERAGRGRTTTESATLPPATPPASIPDTKYQIHNTASVTLEAMRAAPSVYEFIDHLGAQMAVEAKTGKKTREQAMADFQMSPLYRAYVASGKDMLEGREPQALTRSEFEAIAEFRTSLKKILNS